MSGATDLARRLAAPLPSREAFERCLSQHARLLTIETPLPAAALLVERLSGREALSECFRFEVDCLSSSAHFELKSLVGEEVTLRLLQADGSRRAWHGYVTRAAQLGADGGLARYRLTLSPWLAFLGHRRDSYVFQDKTAVDIAQALFARYRQANYAIRVEASLRRWSLRTQYRESDLQFLERILAAEGLSYWFEHEQAQGDADGEEHKSAHARHTLVICDARYVWPACPQTPIRFRRLSATEAEDAVHAWSAWRAVQTNAVTLSSWDYEALAAPAAAEVSALAAGELPTLEHYAGAGAYRYRDADDAARIARLRLQRHELANKCYQADSSVRALAAAQRFRLIEHPHRDGADDAFVVMEIEHEAANNLEGGMQALDIAARIEFGTYRNAFRCVSAAAAVVPAHRPAPTAPGQQSALVVGIAGEPLTSDRDHRVKIQFPWQRGEQPNPGGLPFPSPDGEALTPGPSPAGGRGELRGAAREIGNAPGNETSGTWVRVVEALAGPNWGANFTPRIGTEVLVGFVEGDIDRPLILGQIHNGQDALPWPAGAESGANHPGVIAGIHSLALGGEGYNQWLFDDASGQLRMRLASSHAASQLNLGYLIAQAPASATRGAYRGSGFELRTDAWGVLRAREGLLVSTTARAQGASTQLDVAEAIGQLEAARTLAERLGEAALHHGSCALAATAAQAKLIARIDPQQQGKYAGPVGGQATRKPRPGSREPGDPVERFAAPLIVLDAPASVAFASPASGAWFAGADLQVTGQGDALFAAAHTFSAVSANASALFAHAGGIRAIAASGPVSVQAHTDRLELIADQSVTVTSVSASIEVKAKQKITLIGGQSSISLEGADITFACPGLFSVKGTGHAFLGPGGNPASLPVLPDELTKDPRHWIALDYRDPETGAGIDAAQYEIHFKGGPLLSGTLDANGKAQHDNLDLKEVAKVVYKPRKPGDDQPYRPHSELLG